jgi:hypothetical protein
MKTKDSSLDRRYQQALVYNVVLLLHLSFRLWTAVKFINEMATALLPWQPQCFQWRRRWKCTLTKTHLVLRIKYPLFLLGFDKNWTMSINFSKTPVAKIHPGGAQLFQADRRTDSTKLVGVSRNFGEQRTPYSRSIRAICFTITSIDVTTRFNTASTMLREIT